MRMSVSEIYSVDQFADNDPLPAKRQGKRSTLHIPIDAKAEAKSDQFEQFTKTLPTSNHRQVAWAALYDKTDLSADEFDMTSDQLAAITKEVEQAYQQFNHKEVSVPSVSSVPKVSQSYKMKGSVMSKKNSGIHQEYKLLVVLSTGRAVTVEEIESTLGKEIFMYRLSTYIWRLKKFAGAEIKVNRTGRKVSSYQVMNPEAMQTFLKTVIPAAQTPSAPAAVQTAPEPVAEPVSA